MRAYREGEYFLKSLECICGDTNYRLLELLYEASSLAVSAMRQESSPEVARLLDQACICAQHVRYQALVRAMMVALNRIESAQRSYDGYRRLAEKHIKNMEELREKCEAFYATAKKIDPNHEVVWSDELVKECCSALEYAVEFLSSYAEAVVPMRKKIERGFRMRARKYRPYLVDCIVGTVVGICFSIAKFLVIA